MCASSTYCQWCTEVCHDNEPDPDTAASTVPSATRSCRGSRRCRKRCDGSSSIERHKVTDDHNCVEPKCVVHVCKPIAASPVRQIRSIISGTLTAAVR